jgi:L-lactate dehydrogenase (cytochrome)
VTIHPSHTPTDSWAAGKPAPKGITCIEDLRLVARRKVPRAFFDYTEAGSYSEQTLRANRDDLKRIKLRQRVLVDVSQRDHTGTILGEPVPMPLALAPVAMSGLVRGDGEILACRAAHLAGIPYTLSTMSICSIEDVAKAVGKPFWFQLYVMRDRGFVRSLIERAAAARCSALVVTVDLQVLGQRHRDIKNGLTVPPELKLKNILDMATKPAWLLSMLRRPAKITAPILRVAAWGGPCNSIQDETCRHGCPERPSPRR